MMKDKIELKKYYSTKEFLENYIYEENNLGVECTEEGTTFRLWSPQAECVSLNLYQTGNGGNAYERIPMKKEEKGVWSWESKEELHGVYYDYLITRNGEEVRSADPYAKACGVNGLRSMAVNLKKTNPKGWEKDQTPEEGPERIVYELHVKEFSWDKAGGFPEEYRGKYKAFTCRHTTLNGDGIHPTGLDYLKELGVTHIQIMPMYDYGSVNEAGEDTEFNWGYDPVNYNVPEGSYATDARHGEVRIREMKEMIQAIHEAGFGVIMDVVYNHVYNASDFCVNQIVPGYFSRVNEDGTYSNGSDCGNDTASERSMVRKYIVDSVKYWADEYHIDGFRFDLVGLIDTETINEVVTEVHKTHPDVIFYGEGWTMDTAVTKDGYKMTTQPNSTDVPGFAFFSDTLRDALKGHVFYTTRKGYVSGAADLADTVKGCFLGQAGDWCTTPAQSINYASCHDNMTLLDRITRSTPGVSEEDRIRMNNLSAAIYMTAQGIPFLQAGEEMLRTKIDASGGFLENSYNSPDSVNSIKWDTLEDETYQNVYNYYKGLIAFRKAHAALRLTNADDVNANITSVDGLDENVLAFRINGGVNGETSDGIFVIFNPNNAATSVTLPDGAWDVCVDADHAGTEALTTVSGSVSAEPISAMVLVKKKS